MSTPKQHIAHPPPEWFITGFFIHPSDLISNSITTIFSPLHDISQSEWVRSYKGKALLYPLTNKETLSETESELAERHRRSKAPSPSSTLETMDRKVSSPLTLSSIWSGISTLHLQLCRASHLKFRAERYNRANPLGFVTTEIERFLEFAKRSERHVVRFCALSLLDRSPKVLQEGLKQSCEIVLSEIDPAIVIFDEFLDTMEYYISRKEEAMDRMWQENPAAALREMTEKPSKEAIEDLAAINRKLEMALYSIPE